MVFPVSRDRKFFWVSYLVSALCAVVLVFALLPGSARAEDPPVDPPAPVAAPASGEAVDFPSAVIRSKATGKRVEVSAERSESSTTWVNADGTVTTEQYAAPVRFQDEAGDWQRIDTTLAKQADGTVEPKAVPDGVELAGAVAGAPDKPVEVASVSGAEEQSWSVALAWGGTLASPSLKGSTVTYPNAWPGIDLMVKASRDGFEQSFVLKDRASVEAYVQGQAGDLVTWDLPILVEGVTAREVEGERIEFVDAQGAVVSTFEAPMAWDAYMDEASREHTNHVDLGVSIAGQDAGVVTLRLEVPRSWLMASDQVFPVTVDPVYAAGNQKASFDAYVQSNISSDRSSEQELKVGTYDGTNVARSFLGFPTSAYSGQQIMSASLNLYETWSYSCTASGLEAWSVGCADGTARWTKQPNLISKAGSVNVAKRHDAGCGAGWVNMSRVRLSGRPVMRA